MDIKAMHKCLDFLSRLTSEMENNVEKASVWFQHCNKLKEAVTHVDNSVFFMQCYDFMQFVALTITLLPI